MRFDVKTPGRDDAEPVQSVADAQPPGEEAARYLAALGGTDNLLAIDACMTRLRLNIASRDSVDEAALKGLGAAGMIYPTNDTMQVVVGLRADAIAAELRRAAQTGASAPVGPATQLPVGGEQSLGEEDLQTLLQAIGGSGNVKAVEAQGTRLKVRLNDAACVDQVGIATAGLRCAAVVGEGLVHLLADGSPEPIARELRLLIDAG